MIFGDEADSARQLPLALGNRLRSLQLKGRSCVIARTASTAVGHDPGAGAGAAGAGLGVRLTRLGSFAKRALPSIVIGA